MELAVDPSIINTLTGDLTPIQRVAVATWKRTSIVPYQYQVDFTLALEAGRDVVCIAGTGSGKSLAFVMIAFTCPDTMIWIVSPLNIIENQMARNYTRYGLSAVSVNASTINPQLLEEIEAGKYQVVISSPEAYKDTNKLRPVLLSEKLKHKRHVTITDEAHTIKLWGQSGFRKDFLRIGDMRVFMPNPENAPMCAATATCSPSLREEIVEALKIKPNYCSINLGCWRPNLHFSRFIMQGGQTSYAEVSQLFEPRPEHFEDTQQALVFVEDYVTVHNVAYELRQHHKLTGEEAAERIAIYHSLLNEADKARIEQEFREGKIRILVSTEALTMGADFPNVQLVINFLSPRAIEIWLQRAGRGARAGDIICTCIIMLTKKMVTDACVMCKEAGIEVDPVLAALKAEEESNNQDEVREKSARALEPSTTGRYAMSLGMAEYIATEGCLVAVIDRYFRNPAHIPCIEIGGCMNCKRDRERQGTVDIHQDRRLELKQETQELQVEHYNPELAHKKPRDKPVDRTGAECERFVSGLKTWRRQTLEQLLVDHDASLASIMTDKELKMIAKTRNLTEPSVFAEAATFWPGRDKWRVQIVQVLADLQQAEDKRITMAEAEKEYIRAKKELTRVEKERKGDMAAAEHARKAQETAARKAKPKRLVPNILTQVSSSINPPPHADFIDESGSFFFPATSSATPAQRVNVRAVGTIQVGGNGLPITSTSGPSRRVKTSGVVYPDSNAFRAWSIPSTIPTGSQRRINPKPHKTY